MMLLSLDIDPWGAAACRGRYLPFVRVSMMESPKSTYEDLLERLKALFGELVLLKEEIQRLREEKAKLSNASEQMTAENDRLRDELAVLCVYLAAQTQSNIEALQKLGLDVSDLWGYKEQDVVGPSPRVDHRAMAFFTELPDTIGFTAFFDRASEEGLDPGTVKKYLHQYFHHGLMEKAGTKLIKTDSFRGAPTVTS